MYVENKNLFIALVELTHIYIYKRTHKKFILMSNSKNENIKYKKKVY
jgi:hypothetical protein